MPRGTRFLRRCAHDIDCAARMTGGDGLLRPKPLIPTRIDILLQARGIFGGGRRRVDGVFLTCVGGVSACFCVSTARWFSGGGGVSGDLYLEAAGGSGLSRQFGSAAVRGHAVPKQHRPERGRASANTRPSSRAATSGRCDDRRNGTSARLLLK